MALSPWEEGSSMTKGLWEAHDELPLRRCTEIASQERKGWGDGA